MCINHNIPAHYFDRVSRFPRFLAFSTSLRACLDQTPIPAFTNIDRVSSNCSSELNSYALSLSAFECIPISQLTVSEELESLLMLSTLRVNSREVRIPVLWPQLSPTSLYIKAWVAVSTGLFAAKVWASGNGVCPGGIFCVREALYAALASPD